MFLYNNKIHFKSYYEVDIQGLKCYSCQLNAPRDNAALLYISWNVNQHRLLISFLTKTKKKKKTKKKNGRLGLCLRQGRPGHGHFAPTDRRWLVYI